MLTLQKTALAAALAFCANGTFAQSDDLSYASSEDVPSVPEVSFVHSISDADLRYAFGDAADLQVVALNAQQMEETEGAWVPLVFHGARLAITGAARWAAPHIVRGAKHAAPHAGEGALGGMLGYTLGHMGSDQPMSAEGLGKAALGGAIGGAVASPIRSDKLSGAVGTGVGAYAEGWMNRNP